MTNVFKNRGNVPAEKVKTYKISDTMVTEYLRKNVLGLKNVYCEYERWVGPDVRDSYVRMRCVFAGSDLIVSNGANANFATKLINSMNAGIKYDTQITNKLKPFRYPSLNEWQAIQGDPKTMGRLFKVGVSGERLTDLIRNSEFGVATVNGEQYVVVYLRPESIVKHILEDSDTGKMLFTDEEGNVSDASFYIESVTGTTSTSFTWNAVVKANNGLISTDSASIDAIFANKSSTFING